MAFTKEQLLLSPDKAAQLEKALATLEVDDPLQYLCDEAAAVVARMTAGYSLADEATRQFVRALALFNAYTTANVPPPDSVKKGYDDAMKELAAIAGGERPNLPKATDPDLDSIAGKWGSETKVKGRMSQS